MTLALAAEDVDAATSDVDAERVFVWGTGPAADSRWLRWTAGVSDEERVRLAEEDEPAPRWFTEGIPIDELEDERRRVAQAGGPE